MHSPIAQEKDKSDDKLARWGRARHEGYVNFARKFLQPAPMFFTQDHHPLWIGDIYRGRSCFLIASGPSFAKLDHEPLRQAGVLTFGVNNSPRTFRPNMWCCVDQPDHWIRSTWLDPRIMKFVPISMSDRRVFNSDKWQFMDVTVGDCPNVVYFKRNEHFQPQQYLWEDCINWGNHKKYGGGRSVLLAAIRILFILGIRKVYLLGVDFNMAPDRTYHFDQRRHPSSVSGNMDTYSKLQEWFKQLRPLFESEDFHVFNANPDSNLKAFEFVSYKDALEECSAHMDFVDLANERTRNLYETETREKEEGCGKSPTWFRMNAPRGCKRCRYCGKKCMRVEGDEGMHGLMRITAGCEHSRRKLWTKNGNMLSGPTEAIRTGMKPEREAVAEWNLRFGNQE